MEATRKEMFMKNKQHYKKDVALVMGAEFQKQQHRDAMIKEDNTAYNTYDIERFFRPSCRSVLNNRLFDYHFFNPYIDKKYNEIILPTSLMISPEDTILNYFSILREAENLTDNLVAGCGTVGEARIPFPIAFNFLTTDYQQKHPYPKYLSSFKGIAHTNLIKFKQIPTKNPSEHGRYFVELETINGSPTGVSRFEYYYGYISTTKENNVYKIDTISLTGEDFLCAAYHGWAHTGEDIVDVEYGHWCNLIKKKMPTKKDGYVKTIEIIGTDGNDYRFVFFQLTNDTDILISQYIKKNGAWELTEIDPRKCVKNIE
ncbi:DUF4377 domain-containing protein [Sporosarcina sp. ANT_H38]